MLVQSIKNLFKSFARFSVAGIAMISLSCDSDMEFDSTMDAMKTIPSEAGHGFVADNTLIAKELSRLKKVVANIRTLEDVRSNGWIAPITDYIPNMGYHWANPDFLGDGEFVIEEPDAILVACGPNGKLEAIAVEYIVPVSDVNTVPPPEGFSGDADQWVPVGSQLWTLHVWIKKPNSAGLFNPTNEEVDVVDNCSGS